MRLRGLRLLGLIVIGMLLVGCGQKGDLYLPPPEAEDTEREE